MSDDSGNKKKLAMIGMSSILLVAMVVAVTFGVKDGDESQPAAQQPKISTSSKSVESLCHPTNYKQTCQDSLNKAAGNTTDPQKLVQIGFQVGIDALTQAIKNSTTLKEVEKDPLAKQALDDCKNLMTDAIDDLKVSINQVEVFDVSKLDDYLADLKTWLSATITYQKTCLNGFQNTTSQAGEKMKKILVLSSELTSNGLAMVSGLSTIFKDLGVAGFSGRRLMANNGNEFPSWLSEQKRRLLAAPAASIKADVVVDQDGSGQYKTINEAIKNIPKNRNTTYVVHVKAGIYKEQVTFSRSLTHILLMGDGATKTIISGNLSFAGGVSVFQTATVSASGNYFMAKDIGFENAAGAIGHQAVALKVQADMSVFYNCKIDGFQNTLFAHTYRQFYRDCTITGTVDMIFGDATAVFQNCKLVVKKPLETQTCVVTAQGRNETRQTTGFVLQNCTISANKEFFAIRLENKAFLGRPAELYSRVVVMQSQIDDLIDPAGWKKGFGTFGTETGTYAEYQNRGKGADTKERATWKGVKQLTAEEAANFASGKFLEGDRWIPATKVPYEAGLMKI